MTGTLHNLQSHELLVLQVPAQPDSTEVPPSQFAYDVVSVVEEVANLDGMITALAVITRSLLFVIIGPENFLLLLLIVLQREILA